MSLAEGGFAVSKVWGPKGGGRAYVLVFEGAGEAPSSGGQTLALGEAFVIP